MTEPWLAPLCCDLLKEDPAIEDASVDLVITSYPYKRKDGYSIELMEALGRLLGRVMRPGARLFFNGGQLRESFTRPFEARDIIEEWSGLKPAQTIAWVKSIAMPGPDGALVQRGHYQPLNSEKVLNYAWEPIFTFYQPPELDLNRRSIGAPFTDKSNMKRGTRGQHGDLHCAGDVWFIPYKTTGAKTKKASTKTAHAYGYPEELVERCIKVSNIAKGSDVLDPFLGSGTTAVVGKRLGMNVYGVERDLESLKIAEHRWGAEKVGDHGEEREATRVD